MSKLMQEIEGLCHAMKLPALFQALENQETSGLAKDMSFHERLLELIRAQIDANHRNRVARYRRAANIRWPHAVIEHFKDSDVEGISFQVIKELTSCHWIERRRHVVFTGATGVGKSHLASALTQEAIVRGYTALTYSYLELLQDFTIAKKDSEEKVDKLLKKLCRVNVLIIDDFCMEPLNKTTHSLLFRLVEKRDQAGSLIITSQFSALDWYGAMPHKNAADSIIDRIVSYSDEFELKGPSYRAKASKGELS